jgi:tetratricopeptide (TPR) repeat protein
VSHGQELYAQQRVEEGLEALRNAYRLDERSRRTRAVLCDALAEQGQNLLEVDWRSAEGIIEEALGIDPGHALAKSLRTLIGDRKKHEFIDVCIASARQLQAAGDLEGASEEVGRGLAVYPQEPRLSQLHQTLASSRVGSGLTVDEPGEFSEPLGPSLEPPAQVGKRVGGGVHQLLKKLLHAALERANGRLWPSDLRLRREGIGAAIVIVALVGGVGLVTRILKSGPVPPPPPAIVVHLNTSPQGARILINNKDRGASPLEIPLQEGTYKISALKEGYQPLSRPLTVKRGSSAPPDLTLTPLATTLSVFTDLKALQIWLEGQPAGEMKDGQFVLDLPAGPHNLRIAGRDATATVLFEVTPGDLPVLTNASTAKDLKVIALSSLGSRGKVQSTFGPIPVALDGEPLGEMGSEGLELKDLTRGSHLLTWGQGKEQGMKQFEAGPAPAVTIWLMSERAVGSLVVHADQDDAQVWVDGTEKGSTKNGIFRIPNLPAREYVVEVTKEEFESDPEEQSVNVVKGSDTIVEFKLRPAKAPDPEPNPQDKLRQQALEAYANQHYVFPAQENAVYYWKQLLERDPKSDDYKARLDDSLQGAVYQAGQALRQNDFDGARQIADALAELLPERGKDVSSLRDEIQTAQEEYDRQHRPAPPSPPAFTASVRHLHAHKAYCQGTLSVSAHQLKFTGESASDGVPHTLTYACSSIQFKKHRHDEFEVRTAQGKHDHFAPLNPSAFQVDQLQSACAK